MIPIEYAPHVTLALLAVAFALFVWERFPPEVVALSALSTLLALGVMPVERALQAMANPAPLTIACMFILSGAMVRVGALDAAAAAVSAHARDRPAATLAALAAFVLAASAVMNNTAVVVILIPVAVRLAATLEVSVSKLLMPLSYAAVMGGLCTMIGTSTNLIVDGVARAEGLAPFTLFEIAPLGLVVAAVGMAYLYLVGRHALPERRALIDMLGARKTMAFMAEIAVPPGSPLIDRRAVEIDQLRRDGVRLIDVLRGDRSLRTNLGAVVLAAGDRLILKSSVGELLSLRQDKALVGLDPLSERDSATVEALISPGCRLVGRSLGALRLRRRYGVYPLAVHRRGERTGAKLDEVVIRVGDTLLLEGDPDDIRRLADDVDLVELSRPSERPFRRDRAPVVIGAFVAVLAFAALEVAPIAVLALAAVAVVLLSGCIDAEEAFAAVDGRLLALILAMLGVGAALQETGAAALLVEAAAPALQGLHPALALWLLILTTSALTEAVTNSAVAVVMTPVAVALAGGLGVDPRPLVVGVMVAASASFATPIGYQTNTMIYAPGGYRFTDFLRVGGPLNLLVGVVAALAIPMFWAF